MTKVAILIDGGFFSKAVGQNIVPTVKWPTADVIYRNAIGLRNADEELFRIFYYDSRPYRGIQTNPVSRVQVDYSRKPATAAREHFLRDIGQKDYIALRCGEVKARGWVLTDSYLTQLSLGPVRAPGEADYQVAFEQKGVDMRIGIDVATLSIDKHVDRIIVATNDTDLVPAFKLARRNGIQVAITHVGSFVPHSQLVEDADFIRKLTPVS